jgi:rhodanese-related sulfurtransferase
VVILDVRRDLEWADSHIEGAIHIPLHELPGRLAEAPSGELWVYCRSGFRATVAASLLEAAGRTVVAIDDDYYRAGPTAASCSAMPRTAASRAER